MTAKWKVAVLLGGSSAERDVSIASGAQVVTALRQRGHEVWAVDPARGTLDPEHETALFGQGVSATPPGGHVVPSECEPGAFLRDSLTRCPDLWFIALHGGAGEDGRIQALLELTHIPYTGSGVMGSSIAMDKDISKRLLMAAGVPTPDWLMAPVNADEVGARLGWPVVVKPSKQGSTVGLSVVREPQGLQPAIQEALRHDDEVMVERFIPGRELTCPVLGDSSLSVGEILLQRDIFDYEAKYQPGLAREVFPAELDPVLDRKVKELTLLAHRALKLSGYSRSDFRLDPAGQLWCLEVNTLPGLTAMSLLPQAAAASGITFGDLVEQICQLALTRRSMADTTRSATSNPV